MTRAAAPLLTRVRIATFTTANLAAAEARYTGWLDYRVGARGTIDAALAHAWRAPAMAGRPMLMLRPAGAADAWLRVVQADAVPGYRPLTTFGWNAIELVVEDPPALHARLRRSPFTILAPPLPLQNHPSIVAMQVAGPDGEVLYLTAETGDRARSLLPTPDAFVGRPFIAVLAAPDVAAMLGWYATHFGTARARIATSATRILQHAQRTGPGHRYPTGIVGLAQPGNLIQCDEYPAGTGARPCTAGQLPPGVAMHSFGIADLGACELPFLAPPKPHPGPGYDGRRAATLIGPAGELIELIED